jgi:hypothetical protein
MYPFSVLVTFVVLRLKVEDPRTNKFGGVSRGVQKPLHPPLRPFSTAPQQKQFSSSVNNK